MVRISATNVGAVSFDILSNRSAFTREIKTAGNAAQGIMGGAMKKVGAAVAAAFSVKYVTAFARECVELGSDLAEVQNVVDVTFGKSASKINAWARTTATAFGVSELNAKQFSGTIGAMFKSMGHTESAAFDMSTSLVELAGDMASFYNLDVQTAFDKIRSGISGETEPLKQLGINMSVANLEAFALSQGITQSYNSMTQANQALLRYNYLMSVTADAQGDFSRTSNSWANQTRILSLQFESFKATVGSVIIQVLTPLLQILNRIMAAANRAASAIASLFGKKNDTAGAFSSTAVSAGEATESITDTGNAATVAAKKIKRAFAAYDEINVLSFGAESSSSGGSGAASGLEIAESSDIAGQSVSETEKKLDSLKSKLQNFWKGFAAGFEKERGAFQQSLKKAKSNVSNAWKDIKSLGSPLKEWASSDAVAYFTNFCHVVTGIFLGLFDSTNKIWGDIWDVATFPFLEKFITKGLPTITQFQQAFDSSFLNLFENIKEVFDATWSGGIVPLLRLGSDIFTDIMDTISEKWKEYGAPVFNRINKAVTKTKEVVVMIWHNHLKPCWDALMDTLDEIWNRHLKPLVDEIVAFAAEFSIMATNIYNNFIQPIVMWLQEKLAPVFNRVFTNILNFVKPIVSGIIDSVSGIITTLKGVVQFISGVFSGDWSKAWTGIKNAFSGVWKTISSVLKTPINAIFAMIENLVNRCIGGINSLIRGFNSIKWNVPDWVPVLGGKSVGFNIRQISNVTIPRLAEGGWVRANNPQLAIVGDNRREGEIIAPESKITEAVEKAKNVARDIKLMIEVVVNYPDGRRIIKQINQAQLEEGRILLEV